MMSRCEQGRSAALRPLALAVLMGAMGTAGPALAQPPEKPEQSRPEGDVPEWLRRAVPNPDDPARQQYSQHQKQRVVAEKELRKLRATYFKAIRNPKIRAEGIVKLHDYNSPALFPSLIEIFQHEQDDVRTAVVDILYLSASDEGDASLTWIAIEGEDPEFRAMAKSRLLERISAGNGASNRVRLVILQGLKSQNDARIGAAAQLAGQLGLFETIPWLINAQLGGSTASTGGAGGDGQGALAWILVGQQQAFVSDLTPVVGESAVAFDPQLSTLTTGTILRVFDAHVVTYRTEVNAALIGLSSRLTGRDMSGLGWNQPAWGQWYRDEGKAMIAAKRDEAQAPAQSPAEAPK
ncbi:MAG: hypothetical protein IT436_05415 [Phycisphaerales bacterium]|nr:hypothetical protein [Phycisphaerales bacterium]